jgi:hypothetical protein
MSFEGNPVRDSGPFVDSDQARAQFDAITHGVPVTTMQDLHGLHDLVLIESTVVAGVELSTFERDTLGRVGEVCDSETVQVIAGIIIRARLAGRDT